VLGGINCMPANKSVEQFMREERTMREKFMRQRLRRGIAEGDLPRSTDVQALVSFYTSIVDGMAMRARDGVSRKTLNTIVNGAMAAWDTLAEKNAASVKG